MKMGNFIVRVFEDGKRLDLSTDSSETLPLLPIVRGGTYDPQVYDSSRLRVIPESGEWKKSKIFAINFLIDLFERVPQKTIMDRYDIRLTPYGHSPFGEVRISTGKKKARDARRPQEIFLTFMDGKPYLAGENFGQFFIPLGAESILFSQERHKKGGSIQRAFASIVLNEALFDPNFSVRLPNSFPTSYMKLRSNFILTGGRMENFPAALNEQRDSGWLVYDEPQVQKANSQEHLPNPDTMIYKMEPFSWHPVLESAEV